MNTIDWLDVFTAVSLGVVTSAVYDYTIKGTICSDCPPCSSRGITIINIIGFLTIIAAFYLLFKNKKIIQYA